MDMSDLFARVVTLRMLLFPDPEGSGYRLHGRPLAQIGSDGEILYVLNDHLGTPTALLDSAKTVRWSAEWYPFGSIYDEQVNERNNIRFPGQWRDTESDIYYNWHRYYDPRTGRYAQADPIGLAGGVNHYAYVGNNPIGRSDIAGLDWYETYDGSLSWHNGSQKFIGPVGNWYAESIVYPRLEDDGSVTEMLLDQETAETGVRFIPNVTADFRRMMNRVRVWGWAQRYEKLMLGERARVLMMWVYAPYAPCDLENSMPTIKNHDFVRLFGDVLENDDPGNILFGYGATAAGYSPLTSIYAAGVVQVVSDVFHGREIKPTSTMDALKDTYWIQRGIELYHNGGVWK
jgi:RHS repeat-associated protein